MFYLGEYNPMHISPKSSNKSWIKIQKIYLGDDLVLTMHNGSVRDVCFIEDTSNKSSLLISGGGGDYRIYVTDCSTGTAFQVI